MAQVGLKMASKLLPRGLKNVQDDFQDGSRAPKRLQDGQERPKTAQDRLKTPQDRLKTASRSNFASIFVLRWPKMTSSSLPEPILAQLGPILGPFWPQLGPLRTPRTLQKCRFSLGFCTFSAFHLFLFIFCCLELREALLAPSWPHLGPSWGHLGHSWGLLGAILASFRALLGPSWTSKMAFWLGRCSTNGEKAFQERCSYDGLLVLSTS